MTEKGYYYLHTNGDLIYKRYMDSEQVADFIESDFVKMFWDFDSEYRGDAWKILVCALALGANKKRIKELAEKWNCTNEDAKNFALFFKFNLYMDGNAYCANRSDFINIQESPCGFGDTAIEAIAELLKELDYKAQKMWGKSFENYLK
jgi:hypothetical protein